MEPLSGASSNQLLLLQPRHSYAPNPSEECTGHVYMPTSLLAAAARLLNFGWDVRIVDENLEGAEIDERVVGLNLVGSPYIPIVRDYIRRIVSVHGERSLILLGGQVVNGLRDGEFARLFGPTAVRGNDDASLAEALGISQANSIPSQRLSLIPAYRLLGDAHLRAYLNTESCFYLSQGCRFSCSFCAADRSHRSFDSGRWTKRAEVYRDCDIAARDLEFLMSKACSLGIPELHLYLSNLDLLQTPHALGEFCLSVITLRERFPGISLRMRGLATVTSLLHAHEKEPDVLHWARKAGIERIGFGIDGATPKVFKETRKPQRSSVQCVSAVKIARMIYGFTPEILMVFGHNDVENKESLSAALDFAWEMQDAYGGIPRPHVAKNIVPGNDGWQDPANSETVERLCAEPRYFQHLDFTALPSSLTHPNEQFRSLVAKYYIRVCQLPGAITQYTVPVPFEGSEAEIAEANRLNLRKYDI